MNERAIKTLRTPETHIRYERHVASKISKACYLCTEPPLKQYKYWKIIENQYPYDEVATMNHMVVSSRHVDEDNLSYIERREFLEIKDDLHQEYDMIVENTRKQKSIPGHHHLHLLCLKERVIATDEKRPQAVFLTPRREVTGRSGP